MILSTSTPQPIDQTEGCQRGGWFCLESPGINRPKISVNVQKIQSNLPNTLPCHCHSKHFRHSEKSKASSSRYPVSGRSKITRNKRIPPPTCFRKLLSPNIRMLQPLQVRLFWKLVLLDSFQGALAARDSARNSRAAMQKSVASPEGASHLFTSNDWMSMS